VLGWRRPGGAVRDQTDRGSVHTSGRRGATAAKNRREAHRGSGAVRIKNPRRKPLNRGERRGSPTTSSGSLAQEGRRPGGSVLPQRTGVACIPSTCRATACETLSRGPSQLGIREDEKRRAGKRGRTRRKERPPQRKWRREPGAGEDGGQEVLLETLRAGVACIPEDAVELRPRRFAERPATRFGSREDKGAPTGIASARKDGVSARGAA